MILRTTALYLAVFLCILLALSAGAYAFMAREYTSLLAPALATPEGAHALAVAMRRVLWTLLSIDLPLVAIVGIASYVLARTTIAPLDAARERERVFAADAAHELRSPLAAIASIAQAARNGASNESREAFEAITRTAMEASAIVGDLLTLARDPGRGALHCEPVDLAAIVAGCSRENAAAASERGVQLQASPQSAIVDGDERRLRELVRNLLENAIRHAHASVRIAVHRNGRNCEIIVDDDGTGVPAEERERVFERFYRQSNDGSGTGLGLAIVRWIVRAHNGVVTISEAPEGGARVIATFPAHMDSTG